MRLRTTLTTLAAAATLALASAPAALAQTGRGAKHSETTVSWSAGSKESVVLLRVLHHRGFKPVR
jgi:hypothetical protein